VSGSEFSRPVALDTLGEQPRRLAIAADADECAALARRFALVAIARLDADAVLVRTGEAVRARGTIGAEVTQSCVATGAPVPATLDAPFDIVFRHAGESAPDAEIELDEDDLDVVFFEGGAIDLGEAAAETLALALDPYPRAPGADAALRAAGVKREDEAGPLGALAGLRDKLGGPDRPS
jgi:uncharacterized metal-binding protein YceD (DUF177 family)